MILQPRRVSLPLRPHGVPPNLRRLASIIEAHFRGQIAFHFFWVLYGVRGAQRPPNVIQT